MSDKDCSQLFVAYEEKDLNHVELVIDINQIAMVNHIGGNSYKFVLKNGYTCIDNVSEETMLRLAKYIRPPPPSKRN